MKPEGFGKKQSKHLRPTNYLDSDLDIRHFEGSKFVYFGCWLQVGFHFCRATQEKTKLYQNDYPS